MEQAKREDSSSVVGKTLDNPAIQAGLVLLGGVAYVVLAEIGSWLFVPDTANHVFQIWPASGFALALLIRGGYKYVVSIAGGAFVWAVTAAGYDVPYAGVLAGVYSISGLAGASLLRRVLLRGYALENIRDIFLFVLAGPLMAGLISSMLGSLALVWRGEVSSSDFQHVWVSWWFSVGSGLLLIAPLFLVWTSRTKINWSNRQAFEVAAWLIALTFLSLVIFSNWVPTDTIGYPLELALFPILAWGAIRFGQRGATTGVVIITIMAVWQIVRPLEADRELTQDPWLLWLFVDVATGTGYFLASIITEVRRREERTAQNEARLRAFTDALPDIAYVISEEGRYLEIYAPQKRAIYEDADSLKGRSFFECWSQEQAEQFQAAVDKTIRGGKLQHLEYSLEFQGEMYWFEGRVTPMTDEAGHCDRVVWLAYEITERKRAEAALKHRDELLDGVAEANRILLGARDIDEGIEAAIATLGERAKVDRVQIYKNGHDAESGEPGAFVAYTWSGPGVVSPSKLIGDVALTWRGEGEQHYKQLAANEVLAGLPHELPPRIRACVEGRGAQSVIFAPIWVERYLWGMIGFDDCHKPRHWEESDTAALRVAAASIGNFIVTKHAEGDLRRAKERADAANSAKGEFLAMMSHEIRTPMNAILGFTDLLAQTELEQSQKEHLHIISRSGKALLELINNILDYSKIESRGIELEMVAFNLETTVMEVLELVLVKAREKGLKVDLDFTGEPARTFVGDPHRLRQIILNLANNAIKFTRQGSVTVKVHIEKQRENDRHRIYFEVVDTGIGIAEEKLHRLFQPFSQADSSTTRKFGGTGLGLVICKRLVEKMGGDIGVRSEEGQGSTFHFDIIAVEAPDAVVRPNRAGGERLYKEFAQEHPLSILVVEDDPVNQHLDRELLGRLGFTPDIAGDGAKAVEMLSAKAYDIVLMDIQLPGKSGLEIIRQIRAGHIPGVSPDLYTVALTAFALAEDQQKCFEAGASNYLPKPIDTGELKRLLIEASEKRAAGKA